MKITRLHPVTAADLDALMPIWLAGNLEAHPFIPADYWRGNVAAVRAALPQADLFVARSGGAIVGFAGLQGDYLAGLFVTAAWRDQGVGGRLLVAVRAACPHGTLAVFTANRRAVQFYRRAGLTVVAERPTEFAGQAEFLMQW